jgi:small subunit ribosomal protein S3
MIERKFVAQKIKEKQVQEFVAKQLSKSGHTKIEIKRTPLGEKIIIHTSRPGLIVGRKGENIKELTNILKTKFNMENPQIEVSEIENPNLDASSVADKIVHTLERFGPKRFKFIGYNTLKTIMDAGAIGAEIIIGGRGVPGARAKSWRFSAGYLKKSGDPAETQVKKASFIANLKSGAIGVKVKIMPPEAKLLDKITLKKDAKEEIKVEELEKPKEDITKTQEKTKKEAKK